MLGKYINQFMADNELSVNEEFFIENMDGNRVLIGCADRYKNEKSVCMPVLQRSRRLA